MKVRNFCIISHIDHGKSTLADRFLELTKTVSKKDMQEQFLDNMELERERGITIKLRPVRMMYKSYTLNMIDTPGHVDFSYEVSRSLAAVEGVVLLVDATKGIQAQTLANLQFAKDRGDNFTIIPVINKIDLKSARTEETKEEMVEVLNVKKETIIQISAKEGTNVEKVLDAIVDRISAPGTSKTNNFRALVFDSEYNSYKGTIAHIRVVDGEVSQRESIRLLASGEDGEVKELGFFSPLPVSQKKLVAGDIGYIATGIKEIGAIRPGDTIGKKGEDVLPLTGYKEPKPMVFSSLYPRDTYDYDTLRNALNEIKLVDPALTFEPESRKAFGRGFRCGFLGSLHSEIISERLYREFDLDLIISAPSVTFKIIKRNEEEIEVRSASDWPNEAEIAKIKEPWVQLEIITPEEMLGNTTEAINELKGEYVDTRYLSAERVLILYNVPLRRIITSFHDRLKSFTKGYASASYKLLDFYPADLAKMEILVASRVEEAFSIIVSRNEAHKEGRAMAERLKEAIPAQQFSVAIQAKVGGRIIARETIKARRKDVTGDLYGGDVTRKRKLLEKQKKGKKRLEKEGRVHIPKEAYFKAFRSN